MEHLAVLRWVALAALVLGLVCPVAASARYEQASAPSPKVKAARWMKRHTERAQREADRINRQHLPYVYGGGHSWAPPGPGATAGYDCSGSVSRVLYAAGLLHGSVMTSDGYYGWGHRGHGPVTVMVGPGHVWMKILGRPFGTSSQNSGGGAGWFRPGRGYSAGFEARTVG